MGREIEATVAGVDQRTTGALVAGVDKGVNSSAPLDLGSMSNLTNQLG
jgi:hypothetical protein